jgi:hypothetical protein
LDKSIYVNITIHNKETVHSYFNNEHFRQESRGAYRALVSTPEGRRPLERLRHRLEDNIEMALREVG